MIVFLNGAFGVGKTSTARVLHAVLPGSVVFDPEWVGSMLMATLGDRSDWPADYQVLPAWRRLVIATVQELRGEVDEPLIVPMSVLRTEVWRELSSGLREADGDLRAFRLTATEATLQARIVGRPESEVAREWCLRHVPIAIAAMNDDEFGVEIPTDERTPGDVGAAILGAL